MTIQERQENSARGVVWDLRDLYAGPDDPRIEADLADCRARADAFASRWRGMLQAGSVDPALLRDALIELEAVYEALGRLSAYAGLLTAVDNLNPQKRQLEDRIDQAGVEIGNKLTFFDLEWLALDDAAAARLAAEPALAVYRHHLESARRYKPHTRSEPEELILNQKSLTARSAWVNLFDELLASLSYTLDVRGETRTLTQSQLLALSHDPDRNLRKAAQECLYDVLSRHEIVLTNILNAVAQDHGLNDKIRGYPDPMASRHLANQVSSVVVARMQEAAESNTAVAHDYYRLKARLLGLEKMASYDQYAPVTAAQPAATFDAGREIVLAAFRRFHGEFAAIAARFFDEHWIDAEVRPGKRGGAFSAGTVPSVHPYIMLNWTDKLRDVNTLAHELGHGVHQYLSRRQPYFYFHHPLTLAEMASVFAEFLTFDHLLRTTADPEVKLGLVCAKIEDAFATAFRQNVLTRFEQSVHAARRERKLSTDEICQHWWDANDALYGDAVEMLPAYRWGWSYIPHFIHTPFYCYAYVFGELLVLSLFRAWQVEGASFVPRYMELLRAGSSAPPADLLRRMGADVEDPEFWQQGFDVLRDLVATAESLARECGRLGRG